MSGTEIFAVAGRWGGGLSQEEKSHATSPTENITLQHARGINASNIISPATISQNNGNKNLIIALRLLSSVPIK